MVHTVHEGNEADTWTCYEQKKVGHITFICNRAKEEPTGDKDAHFVVVADEAATNDFWILDLGASHHIVHEPNLDFDAVDCEDSDAPKQVDGTPLKASSKGKVDWAIKILG